MTSKNGQVTCEYDGPKQYDQFGALYEEYYDFVIDIVKETIDKAFEISNEADEREFEVVEYAENTDHLDKHDFLDAIDENDFDNDTTIDSLAEDVLEVIDVDTDGLFDRKLLDSDTVLNEDGHEMSVSPDITDSR
jgi:hypothetical protein